MSDISSGPGFEYPNYDDLVKQFGQSDNDKLVKVSEILAQAQMTHQALSNFDSYKNAIDTLSKSVFDPIKNQMVNVNQKVNDVAGKFVGSGDNSIDFSDLLTNAKNPKAFLKAKLSEGNTLVKNKLQDIKKQGNNAIDDIKSGKVPDLPTQFASKEDLLQGAKSIAQKAGISDKIVNDLQDVINQRFDSIPDSIKFQLRDMGISDDEIRQVVSGASNTNLTDIVQSKFKNIKYNDPFQSDELDIPQEYLGKIYRANKLLEKLRTPATEGGGLQGDSTIARLTNTGKTAINNIKNKTMAELEDLKNQPELVTGKRLQAKLTARANKELRAQIEQKANEEEFPPVPKPTIKTPNIQEFNDIPEINMQNTASADAFKSLINGETISNDEDVVNTVNKLQKAKNIISKLGEEGAEGLDETPGIGDLIGAGLGIASIGTMIAGLFEPSKPQTTIVSGDQLGV